MTIVDFHCHLAQGDWYSPRFLESVATLISAGSGVSREQVMALYPEIYDITGEKLLREMERAGVDQAVVFPGSDYDLAVRMGRAPVPIEERNRVVIEVARRHPGRLVAFYSIDPRRPGGPEAFQAALSRSEVRGLKLLPGSGFYPTDRVVYPFYEIADQHRVPVLVHVGPVVAPMRSKYATPLALDEVAADFPSLQLVAAHSGFGFWSEMVSIAQNKPNVSLELSGWQTYRRRDPEYFYRTVRTMVNLLSPGRLLFGSDYPFITRGVLDHTQWVRAFTEPPAQFRLLTDGEVEGLLGETALRLLGGKT